MRHCQLCQNTQFEINPHDEALCCTNCGAVAEEAQLRTDSGDYYAAQKEIKMKAESKETLNWLKKYAIFFGSEETFDETLQWYRSNRNKCPQRGSKELALYILYIIKRRINPGLTILDMITSCPDTIDVLKIRHVHSLLSPNVPLMPLDWKAKLDLVFPVLFPIISHNVQYFKNPKSKSSKQRQPSLNTPSEKEVRTMTTGLLKLYSDSGNSAGKSYRPLVAAIIAVVYLHFFQKRIALKLPNTCLLTVQKIFDIKTVAQEIGCGYRTLLKHLEWLQKFIFTCTNELPWKRKDIKLKTAHIYLDEIVQVVKSKGTSSSQGIPLTKETVPIFLQSQKESQAFESALARATSGCRTPLNSVERTMRILLEKGVPEEEIKVRSSIQLRQMLAALYYREMVNSTTIDDIPDLDQKELTHHDMSETELQGYLRTFV